MNDDGTSVDENTLIQSCQYDSRRLAFIEKDGILVKFIGRG